MNGSWLLLIALAGAPEPVPPIHEGEGLFPLTRAHADVTCDACHWTADRKDLVGTAADCAICHVPVRSMHGKLNRPCNSCHEPVPPESPHTYPDRACKTCHPGKDRSVAHFDHGGESKSPDPAPAPAPAEPLTRVTDFPLDGAHTKVECIACHPKPAFETVAGNQIDACGDCHKDPHQATLGKQCGSCHDVRDPFDRSTFTAERHRGAYPLTGAHSSVSCDQCHPAGRYVGVARACEGCHASADPHAGRLGPACGRCHSVDAWSTIRPFDHGETEFALTGVHGIVECDQCHTARARLTDDCVGCHADPHRGGAGLACEDCHSADTWLVTHFDHAHTGFLLNGRHLAVPCRDCHRGDRFIGQPDACITCHGPQRPRTHTFPSARECEACHDSRGFEVPGFVHFPATPVVGVHARVARACNRCHLTARPLDEGNCYDCHRADVPPSHRGFLSEMGGAGRDCLFCHPQGRPWAVPSGFIHPTAITGAHGGLPCSSCHPVPAAIRSGREVCRGCHLDDLPTQNHTPHLDCVDCHNTTSFYPALTQ